MIKKISYIIVVAISILILLIPLKLKSDKKVQPNVEEPVIENTIIDKVNELMDNMTIDEKIAQMLIVDYSKEKVSDTLKETLQERSYGGFILFADNITTYNKTKKFVSDLKNNSKIPLIIAIDQEGGSVQRLSNLTDAYVTDIPYMYDLGKTKDENLSYEVGKVIAEEVRTIGVNVVLGPVVDIFSNKNNTVIGKRSFSSNKNVVSKMAVSLGKGLEDNGVIATYKHFPGHGDTETDSHYNLPIIKKTYKDLNNLELIPFKNAIDNGAKIIMIGHIALPKVTGDNTPASLSKKIITDILKNDMGYDGLIITDALNMGALTNNYSYEQIYVKAINAGVDLLLMPHDTKEAIKYIKKNISEERINESVKKILMFKYAYLNNDNSLDKSYLGNSEHKKIINKIK